MTERLIRPSSLVDFLDCPRRWAARHLRAEVQAAGYDLAQPRASHVGALVGSGVHAGAAYTLDQKRATGAIGRDADALDQAIEGFTQRAQQEGAEWDDLTPTRDTAHKQIARMLTAYRRQVAPKVAPLLVEQRFETTLASGWVLSGQMDSLVVSGDAQQQASTIRDIKTGARKRANGVQYGAYALIAEAHGHRPQELIEDFIPRAPLRREQPPVQATSYAVYDAKLDAWQALQAIREASMEFAARVEDPNGADPRAAFRANPSSSLCNARWCPAWGTQWCRSHRPNIESENRLEWTTAT
jgi:hypothetical protein